jgi:hypothetical protein
MRKMILMIVIAMVVITTSCVVREVYGYAGLETPPQYQVHSEPTGTQVASLVELMRKLNPEITNPRLIKVGQCIAVPIYNGDILDLQVESWMLGNRQRDCLWTIARSYLRGDLDSVVVAEDLPDPLELPVIAPVQLALSSPPVPPSSPPQNKMVAWVVAGIILTCIIILLIIYALMRQGRILSDGLPRWMYGSLDPRRYPPVREDGLSADPLQARLQLSGLRLNKAIQTVEPGRLRQVGGSGGFMRVIMEFADKISHAVDLKEGEQVHRVTFTDQTVEFFRSACANGFTAGQVSRNGELPDGWEFFPDAAQPLVTSAPVTVVESSSSVEAAVNTPPVSTNGHISNAGHFLRLTKIDKAGGTRVFLIEGSEPIGDIYFPQDEEGLTKIFKFKP